MTKTDFIRKITSRKFWVAVVAIVTGILMIFNQDDNTAQQISGLIMTLGSTIAYIYGESWTDASNKTESKEKEEK